jgi:hypothetical protein
MPTRKSAPKKPASKKPAKPPTASLASRIRALIHDGLDNKQILSRLKLPPSKRRYPGWYRAAVARKARGARP